MDSPCKPHTVAHCASALTPEQSERSIDPLDLESSRPISAQSNADLMAFCKFGVVVCREAIRYLDIPHSGIAVARLDDDIGAEPAR